jgi:spermidine synthase
VVDLKAENWNRLEISTDYYTTNLHRGCFALPAYVERMLCDVERITD